LYNLKLSLLDSRVRIYFSYGFVLVPYEKKEKKDNPKQMGSSKIGRDLGYIP